MPGRLPVQPAAARAACCGARPGRSPPAATRRPRASGPPAGRCRSTVVPPGVDTERFLPLDAEARAKARALFDLPADGRLVVSRQPARAPQGHGRAHRGRRPPGAERTRPGRRHRRRGPGPARGSSGSWPATGRARALARPGARRRPARAATGAPTCSPCCAATGGAGSSRRGSASCSSRRPRAACPRWPGAAAERPRPWPTARPGLVVDDPATIRRRGRRAGAAARRPGARGARWAPRPGARAASRVRLRRAGRPAGRGAGPVVNPVTDDHPDDAVATSGERRAGASRSAGAPARRGPRPGPASAWSGSTCGRPRSSPWCRSAAAVVPDPLEYVAVPLDLVLFVVGCVAFLWAYAVAIGRSRYEAITMAGVFFLAGDVAPRRRGPAHAARSCSPSRSSSRSARGGGAAVHGARLRRPRPHARARPDGAVGRPPRRVPRQAPTPATADEPASVGHRARRRDAPTGPSDDLRGATHDG